MANRLRCAVSVHDGHHAIYEDAGVAKKILAWNREALDAECEKIVQKELNKCEAAYISGCGWFADGSSSRYSKASLPFQTALTEKLSFFMVSERSAGLFGCTQRQ